MKRFLPSTLAGCIASACLGAQTKPDLVAIGLRTVDESGMSLEVGSAGEFWSSLDFEVRGNLQRRYKIRFETPYHRIETPELQFGVGTPGTYRVTWGPIPVVVDRTFTLKATLVPVGGWRDGNTKNDSVVIVVTPSLPASPIEFFGHKPLEGRMTLDVSWAANPGLVTAWMPNIVSETFQEVEQVTVPEWLQASPSSPHVGIVPIDQPYQLSLAESIFTIAAKQRVNRFLLTQIPFEAYSGDSPEPKWLAPETYVQSNDSRINAFAESIQRKFPSAGPFALAEQIYLAVGRRCSYYGKPNQAPSAVTAYLTKRGDCGGLSSLFVATCRSAGIPARTVAGFRRGLNRWHVWSEFYVPTAGWIACDLADAEAVDSKGLASAYFGVMPDLDMRVATSFGFDVTSNGATLPLLQAPSVFWTTTAQPTSAKASCFLDIR